jgi:hypothetical protein
VDYRDRVIAAYADKIERCINVGWKGYLFTFMFNQLSGSVDVKVAQMQQEITRVYTKLLTRIIRMPRSPAWADFLPKAIIVPDMPVLKRSKQDIQDVSINDGLHHHGIIATPPWSRITESLDVHFRKHREMYFRGTRKLRKIHVQPIRHSPDEVVEYAMKSLKRGRFSNDHILLLPRSVSELPDKAFSTAHG